MDVYLDDIIIYSNTLQEHIEHCKLVIDILAQEKLYLSESKLHFLAEELKILGRVIDKDGIHMDPHKVDKILNWKVPTNRDLLCGFLDALWVTLQMMQLTYVFLWGFLLRLLVIKLHFTRSSLIIECLRMLNTISTTSENITGCC